MTIIDIIKNNKEFKQWIDGYVDDTAIIANIALSGQTFLAQCSKELAKNLAEIATIWNGLLEASGGKLELSKCFYYLLNWKFDIEGRFRPETISEQKEYVDNITLLDSNKKETSIHQKNVQEAHKTLGMMKNMIGDESDHLSYLKCQSDNIISIISSTPLTRRQAKLAYSCIYIPKMMYSLPAFNLSENQTDILQKKAITTFISRIGYKKSFPRTMVFAPVKYGGLNLPHIYSETNIVKILLLLSHCRAKSQLGQIIMINLNWIQINLGIGTPLLFETMSPIDHIDPNWFTGIRTFLAECNLKIFTDNLWFPAKERSNDKILMDEFINLKLQKNQLKLVNIWRMYFKEVNTLSDICDATGWRILPIYWLRPEHHVEYVHRTSKLNWPIQTIPGPKGFGIWKKCLKACFNIDEKGNLPIPLGMWFSSAASSNSIWESYYADPKLAFLYQRIHDNIFKKYEMKGIYERKPSFSNKPTEIATSPPLYAYPIDTMASDDGILSITPIEIISKKNIRTDSFPIEYTRISDNLSPWEKLIAENSTVFEKDSIVNMINQQMIFAATDGSVKNNSNSFAAIISSEKEAYYQTQGHIWNHNLKSNPARSEILAILAALTSFRLLSSEIDLVSSKSLHIKILSDCLSMVNRINKHRVDILNKEMCLDEIDVKLQVLKELKSLMDKGIIISIHHVKAHLNNKKSSKKSKNILNQTDEESVETALNTIADCLAKTAIDSPRADASVASFPANNIELRNTENHQITNDIKQYIRDLYHFPKVKNHFKKSYKNWDKDYSEEIWWSAHLSALNSFDNVDTMRIQKFINNMLPTNYAESKFRPHINNRCQSCNEPNEDIPHLLQCPCFLRKNIRESFISDLLQKLQYKNKVPLGGIIGNAVSAWLLNSPIPNYDPSSTESVNQAYLSQCNIGWDKFLQGKISILWKNVIDLDERKSEKWGETIISHIFQYFLNCWEQRKNDIYGEITDNNSSELKDLREQVSFVANQNLKVASGDQQLINISKEDIQKMPSNILRAWLYNAKTLEKAFKRQCFQENFHMNKNISEAYRTEKTRPARARLKN